MPSTPILAKKLQAYGITMTEHLTVSDGLELTVRCSVIVMP